MSFRLSLESVGRVQPCYWWNRMPIWHFRSAIAVTCLKRGGWLRRATRRLYGTMTRYAPHISASTERLKTGARRFRRLAERWARRVFRPTESGVSKPSVSGGRQDEPELILTGLRL